MSRLTSMKSFVASAAGDTELLTPRSPSGRLHLFSILYSPNADITGEVKVKLGTKVISGARNPMTGGLYGFNLNPNFMQGETGEKLIVNLPSATAVTFDVCWREAPEYSS